MLTLCINSAAKRAKIIDVKMGDEQIPKMAEISEAWRWAVGDIMKQGRRGKATINFSFGKSSNIPSVLCSYKCQPRGTQMQ